MSEAAAAVAKPAGLSEILDRADQESVRSDLTTFFGPRAAVYLATYDKMRAASGRRRTSQIGWCWPAFFITVVWMFYRKMYLYGASMIILPIIFVRIVGTTAGNGGISIVCAMYAKSWYVCGAMRRIQKADKLGLVGAERADYLKRAGGVSWLAGIISGLVFVAVIGLAFYGVYLRTHHS